MRILLATAGVAVLAWGGYWFLGAQAMERAVLAWFDDRRGEGWQADTSKVDTRGFPNRFDTTLTDVLLADPESGLAWAAPWFQILSLSYRPNHIIAVLPPTHTLSSPYETIEVLSQDTRGSIVFEPNADLEISRATFEVTELSLTSTLDWTLTAEEIRISTRQTPASVNTYDYALAGRTVSPGGEIARLADEAGLPPDIAGLTIDATVAFDAPWDRRALEVARPQPVMIDLRVARAEWGEMLFQAAGKVEIGAGGRPSGSVAVQARNWRAMLDLAVSTGAVPETMRPTLENALGLLAGMSGNPEHIDARLAFRGGFTMVAGLPVGPAPVISLR